MDYTKKDMKFIRVTDAETRLKLLYEGFTEITEPGSDTYLFLNNGKMKFDAEQNGCIYTNKLHI